MITEVKLGGVAHGGVVVARLDGKVVFVTGGLPGERVRIEIDERGARFDRGHVVEVLEAAAGRIAPSCPIAASCGGCDWQHADAATQRQLKTAVVAEQLSRLAGIAWDGQVQEVPGAMTGWRTRVRYLSSSGVVGFRARRSHRLIALPAEGCELAAPGPSPDDLRDLAADGEIEVAVADGVVAIRTPSVSVGPDVLRHRVLGRIFEVAAHGFWQVHPAAAETLTQAVLAGLRPRPGDTAYDLYCGVGLFAGALVDAGCSVTGIEASPAAVLYARRNVPEARFVVSPMRQAMMRLPQRAADLVVLDPPRKGACRGVVDAIARLGARAIAYVSCDPASLARDLRLFTAHGYSPFSIQSFDLFPKTHHVECVVTLRPT